jgi:hypothetical protein
MILSFYPTSDAMSEKPSHATVPLNGVDFIFQGLLDRHDPDHVRGEVWREWGGQRRHRNKDHRVSD